MNHRLFRTLILAGSLGFLAGCQTVESRIKEKPEVFASVDKATQEKIKQGIIDLGYSEDMVYLALGAPDQKRETITTSGRSVLWVYNTYYTRYDGTEMMGYRRRVYFDPYLKTYRLYYNPVFVDTYREDKEERIRITFVGGKVTAIEQAKD
jgi:hypothetical protein